jgi:hypothetical protein
VWQKGYIEERAYLSTITRAPFYFALGRINGFWRRRIVKV